VRKDRDSAHNLSGGMENYKPMHEIYGACQHKTKFHRFLKEHTNMKNTSTDDGNMPEKVYKYDD
jgi:hypothetical protein